MFSVHEIFEFAIRMEENGEKFYRQAAQQGRNQGHPYKILEYLADEEAEHKKAFESMMSQSEKYDSAESYPDEYEAYLKAFVDNIIFKPRASLPDDLVSILDFAMARELDSVLYYLEIKRFVPGNQEESIEKIINEERKHFKQLSELKKTL